MEAASTSRRELWIASACIVLAAVLTYARGVTNGFVPSWDDGDFILRNPDVREVGLHSLRRVFTEVREESYQPLHWLSYWIDVPWSGANPVVVHAVSLAWFCLDLVLLLHVLRALGLSLLAASFACLLFGLHPVNVELVTWATGRKDVVALTFELGAVLMHLRSTPRALWASRALYLCACFAKTVVLPLPGVLFLIDVLLRGERVSVALKRQLPNLVAALGLGALVFGIWKGSDMIRPDMGGTGLGALPLRVSATLTHYLAIFVWPATLSPQYAVLDRGELQAWMLVGPLLVLTVLVVAYRRRDAQLGFCVLAFLVFLLPVSNVVPLYLQWQDRYLSQPLLALAFGVGALLDRARARLPRAVLVGVASAWCLALSLRTVQYQEVWSSDRRLWEHAVATQPEAFFAWMKLGEVYRAEQQLDASVRAFERAVALSPRMKLGHAALFYTLAVRDEQRLRLSPARGLAIGQSYYANADDPRALRRLASEWLRLGYRDVVVRALARSLELDPLPRDRLLRAAAAQRQQGNAWLAAFYERSAR